jgi:hypothetical protein
VLSIPLPVPLVLGWLHECGSGEADARVYDSERDTTSPSAIILQSHQGHLPHFKLIPCTGQQKFDPGRRIIVGETSWICRPNMQRG